MPRYVSQVRRQSASDSRGVRLIVTTALFGLLVVLLAVMISVAGLLVVLAWGL
jgi:hypothetical protein